VRSSWKGLWELCGRGCTSCQIQQVLEYCATRLLTTVPVTGAAHEQGSKHPSATCSFDKITYTRTSPTVLHCKSKLIYPHIHRPDKVANKRKKLDFSLQPGEKKSCHLYTHTGPLTSPHPAGLDWSCYPTRRLFCYSGRGKSKWSGHSLISSSRGTDFVEVYSRNTLLWSGNSCSDYFKIIWYSYLHIPEESGIMVFTRAQLCQDFGRQVQGHWFIATLSLCSVVLGRAKSGYLVLVLIHGRTRT